MQGTENATSGGLRWLALLALVSGLAMAALTLSGQGAAVRPTRTVTVPYGASVYIREVDLPFVLVQTVGEPDIPVGASGYVVVTGWPRREVTYSLENCPPRLDCGAAQNVVRQGVEAWDSASGITLNEVAAGAGDIRIQWEQTAAAPGGRSIDGPGGVLGFTFFPYSWLGPRAGDVYLDPSENWVLGNPANNREIDLLTVVMHEVGHALGIDHSADRNALMYASYLGVRGLNADDIAAAQALYGLPENETGSPPPTPTETPVPAPAAPVQGLPMTATTTVRVRSGPGTDYPQIAQLLAGQQTVAKARSENSEWLQIEIDGQQGWVAAWLMQVQGDISTLPLPGAAPAPTDPTTPTNPQPEPGGAVTAQPRTTLRMRSGPGTGFSTVVLVPQGATVNVVGRDAGNNWLLVQYDGEQGWVAALYCFIRGDLNSVPIAN